MVFKGAPRTIVYGKDEIGTAIAVELDDVNLTGLAGHNDAAAVGPDRIELAAAIA
jgi:hypothetical protein